MNAVIMIIIPMICYAGQAVYYLRTDPPMALVFASYASGNIGWVWYELSKATP